MDKGIPSMNSAMYRGGAWNYRIGSYINLVKKAQF